MRLRVALPHFYRSLPKVRSLPLPSDPDREGVKNKPIRLPGLKPGGTRRVNTERHQPSFKKGVGGGERITAADGDDARGPSATDSGNTPSVCEWARVPAAVDTPGPGWYILNF